MASLPALVISELLTPVGDGSRGNCVECSANLSNKLDTVRSHYKTIHKKEFLPMRKRKRPSEECGSLTGTTSLVTKDRYLNAVVRSTIESNLPLSFWDSSAARELMMIYDESFNMTTSSETVKKQIKLFYNNPMPPPKNIRDELKDQPFCIRFDIDSSGHRSVLGITVQFMQDWEIIVNTIGKINLEEGMGASELKDKIEDLLRTSGIQMKNLYKATVDNGTNVLMTRDELENQQSLLFCQEMSVPQVKCEFEDKALYGPSCEMFPLVSEVVMEFTGELHLSSAGFLVQLAINRYLGFYLEELSVLRSAVKNIIERLRQMPKGPISKPPLLSNTSRWSSTYLMLVSLTEMQSALEEQNLDDGINWTFVKSLELTLKHPEAMVRRMEKEQSVIGDFVLELEKCIFKMQYFIDQGSGWDPQRLLDELIAAKVKLLENPAVKAGMYLDPRIVHVQNKSRLMQFLSDQDKEEAIDFLVGMASQFQLEDPGQDPRNHLEPNFEDVFNYQVHVGGMEIKRRQCLEDLQKRDACEYDTNVLNYWRHHKDEKLRVIAAMALTFPVSQVNIDRVRL